MVFPTAMESVPLKVLDLRLQRSTGPRSASILLVFPRLDCPGVSLAEDYATCLRCHLWSATTNQVFDVQYLQITFP